MNPQHTPKRRPIGHSVLLPITSRSKPAISKDALVLGAATALSIVGLFATDSLLLFWWILACYVGFLALFMLYRLCEADTPWWLLMAAGLITVVLLEMPPFFQIFALVFREILPGDVEPGRGNFAAQLIGNFFGAGLMEELLKAVPILLILFLGSHTASRLRLRGPVDGILLGAASGLAFTLVETMLQYVPDYALRTAQETGNISAGALAGTMLLVPRILAGLTGHMAYAGYFGYFIGLAALRPEHRWVLLSVGLLTAALLHALWNALSSVGLPLQLIAALAAFTFLLAAIQKAKQIEQRQAQDPSQPLGAASAPPSAPQRPVQSPNSTAAMSMRPLRLHVGALVIDLLPRMRVDPSRYPKLVATGASELRGEVVPHPSMPNVIGLKNLSNHAWPVVLPDGRRQQLDVGKTLRLEAGLAFDIDGVNVEVRS